MSEKRTLVYLKLNKPCPQKASWSIALLVCLLHCLSCWICIDGYMSTHVGGYRTEPSATLGSSCYSCTVSSQTYSESVNSPTFACSPLLKCNDPVGARLITVESSGTPSSCRPQLTSEVHENLLGRWLLENAWPGVHAGAESSSPHISTAIQVSWKDYIIALEVHRLSLNSAGSQCCTYPVTEHLVWRDTDSVLQSGCCCFMQWMLKVDVLGSWFELFKCCIRHSFG